MSKKNIPISLSFFSELREKIDFLENTPVTWQESVEFIIGIYNKTCDPLFTLHFTDELKKIMESKINIFNTTKIIKKIEEIDEILNSENSSSGKSLSFNQKHKILNERFELSSKVKNASLLLR